MRNLVNALVFLASSGIGGESIATSVIAPLHQVIVTEDYEFNGIHFPSGSLATLQDSDDSLYSVVLAGPQGIGAYTILEGTDLRWVGRDGIGFCFASRDSQALGEISPPRDSWICLGMSGLLRQIYLKGQTVIQGMPLENESLVKFHDSGKMESGVLATDSEVQAVPLLRGSEVSFFDTGMLRCATLKRATAFQGFVLVPWNGSGGCDIELWPTGKLKRAAFAQTTQVGESICGKFFPVELTDAGNVSRCSTP